MHATSDEGVKIVSELATRLTLLLKAPAKLAMARENRSNLGEDVLIKIGRKPSV